MADFTADKTITTEERFSNMYLVNNNDFSGNEENVKLQISFIQERICVL
jgi:hypothetical protein